MIGRNKGNDIEIDGDCIWIKDQVNSERMTFTNAQVNPTTISNCPFGNAFGVLEFQIENVDREAKNISSL